MTRSCVLYCKQSTWRILGWHAGCCSGVRKLAAGNAPAGEPGCHTGGGQRAVQRLLQQIQVNEHNVTVTEGGYCACLFVCPVSALSRRRKGIKITTRTEGDEPMNDDDLCPTNTITVSVLTNYDTLLPPPHPQLIL